MATIWRGQTSRGADPLTPLPLRPQSGAHLLNGPFLPGRLAPRRLVRGLLRMDALGQHLLAGRAVPLLVLLVGDLAVDEQLRELPALRLALEWHARAYCTRRAAASAAPARARPTGRSRRARCSREPARSRRCGRRRA